jgi:type II secretory pathway pseudopilin PulG
MKRFNNERSFTLVEILVSIFIIILMAGIVFANYRQSGQQFALQRSANKLAQDIRRAQQMAMGARECPQKCEGGDPCPSCAGQVPPGYGIVLQLPPTWPIGSDEKYRIYADINGDQAYDGGDTIIESVDLEKGVYIQSMNCYTKSFNFKPPDPVVNIIGDFDLLSPFAESTITLALQSDHSKTKTIKVNKAGLIEIE